MDRRGPLFVRAERHALRRVVPVYRSVPEKARERASERESERARERESEGARERDLESRNRDYHGDFRGRLVSS